VRVEGETFAVSIIAEDFFAAIPAIDDVIDRTGIFEAQLARHERKIVSTSRTLNRENSQLHKVTLAAGIDCLIRVINLP
jgi:hypothetical protein